MFEDVMKLKTRVLVHFNYITYM